MRTLSIETYDRLVGAIYASGLDSAGWEAFLGLLSDSFRGVWASVHCHDTRSNLALAVTSKLFDPEFMVSYVSEFGALNPWVDVVKRAPVGVAQASETLVPQDTLRKTRFYNEWLRPQEDVGTGAGITLERAQDRLLRLSCNIRFKDQELVQEELLKLLDMLAPHLQRAFAVSRHLRGRSLAREWQQTLDGLAAATVLVNSAGRTRYANRAAEALRHRVDSVDFDRTGRIVFADQAANRAFARAVATIAAGDTLIAPEPFLTCAPGGGRLKVTIAPCSTAETAPGTNSLGDLLDRIDGSYPVAIVCLAESERTRPQRHHLVRAYELTPAEADIAIALCDGDTLQSYARNRGISIKTVRKQLQSAFRKTGTAQQSQLVAALAGNSPLDDTSSDGF